jgi:ATP-dependent Clp protease ATP-binding subunit ClpA
MMLKSISDNLLSKGIKIEWNEKTKVELGKLGYNPIYGARELRRVIQEKIEDVLANLIIDKKIKSGNDVLFDGLTVNEIL